MPGKAVSERPNNGSGGRARGKRLGTPRDPAGAVKRMRAARMAQAAQFAANVLPIIRDIQVAGYTSLLLWTAQCREGRMATRSKD
jgi:hypothetical protein